MNLNYIIIGLVIVLVGFLFLSFKKDKSIDKDDLKKGGVIAGIIALILGIISSKNTNTRNEETIKENIDDEEKDIEKNKDEINNIEKDIDDKKKKVEESKTEVKETNKKVDEDLKEVDNLKKENEELEERLDNLKDKKARTPSAEIQEKIDKARKEGDENIDKLYEELAKVKREGDSKKSSSDIVSDYLNDDDSDNSSS